MALEILSESIDFVLVFLTPKFQEELRQQGHRASGKLEKSFEHNVITMLAEGTVTGQILTEDYGTYVDSGVRANRIRYNPMWLLPWARIVKPGLTEKQRKSFVFAVWQTHKKQGIPSKGSFSFTKNGRRKNWIEATLKENEDMIEDRIEFDKYLQAVYAEAFAQIQGDIA